MPWSVIKQLADDLKRNLNYSAYGEVPVVIIIVDDINFFFF